MLHISEEQVREALPMKKALQLVEENFRRLDDRKIVNHPRRRIRLDNGAMLHAMEAGDNLSGLIASKLYVTRPQVGARFVVTLFDGETTELLAVIDANLLGQIRTGAATGVATQWLARKDAKTLGVIGAGFQAATQLEAIAAVRQLDRVLVYSRTSASREAFASKMADRLDLAVEPSSSPETVAQCDIVVTVTPSKTPVLQGEWLKPGVHVNAAGSNHARRRELGAGAVQKAVVIAVDSLEQARIEAGDLIQAVDEGVIGWDRVIELGGVATGRELGRSTDEDITLFESQGLAAQDLAAAEEVYRVVSGQ